ncbi:Oxoglutarate/iron-dependent dioxygenase [Penicillium argentinense]|uniref:Oxoglutarate/iron-dependent dioxygenase n=1 Tax=Penicillium argentinense TaxID=1131581 RepID=A0A9W9G1Y7_9EURO|nr:Oxoglutarate/iron-dependent dioxygenase [Penicillium argentinense]KAJ5110478.1 Oxoglutarate/iron-dependent dioxygenase [Penicillium argentinense]
MSKRTLDAFFSTASKRTKPASSQNDPPTAPSKHETYPFPIASLPANLQLALNETPAGKARVMNDRPDLDCLYFQPYIPRGTANELFRFLRAEIPFYRVVYFAKRGGVDVQINTPRYTTVFGVDESAFFAEAPSVDSENGEGYAAATPTAKTAKPGEEKSTNSQPKHSEKTSYKSQNTHDSEKEYKTNNLRLYNKKDNTPIQPGKYGHSPRPIPACLHTLKKSIEIATKTTYNFVLVNYYTNGNDSIAFHSDDERFLGHEPSIASLSLGAEREFLLKHKPQPAPWNPATVEKTKQSPTDMIKLLLGSGDMILMRGSTQSNWLHSIPKRKGKVPVGGRINITFRRAVVPAGTDNYYHYNVGSGGVWRWDAVKGEMVEIASRKDEDKGKG